MYAKCDSVPRIKFWDDIYEVAVGINSPWLIRGYFNMVLNGEENIEGLPLIDVDHEDFRTCIESCNLVQVSHTGSPFT